LFTSATVSGSTLTVTGFVGSAANQSTFASSRVEIFKSDGDATGFGEGRYYLGFLTTDGQGNFSGVVTVPGGVSLANGDQITATATDTLNNTSEFGPNCPLPGANFSFSGTVFEDVNYGGGAGRNAATAIAAGGSARPAARVELYNPDGTFRSTVNTDGSGNYSFTNLPPGNYTVRVVNGTVTSARSGYSGSLLSVQTYRSDATAAAVVAVTDHVGGETPNLADAASNVGNATLASLTTGSAVPSVRLTATASARVIRLIFGSRLRRSDVDMAPSRCRYYDADVEWRLSGP